MVSPPKAATVGATFTTMTEVVAVLSAPYGSVTVTLTA
jgi:hypothetical protein